MSGATSASFTYDGDGNRVKSVMGNVTTVYIGNYFEWTGSTSTMVKYYYAGGQRVAMRKGTANPTYLLGDHLGSTSITANSNGTLATEQRYYPWGATRYSYGGTAPTAFQYTGQRNDSSIGLYFYNARYYDPALGRFVQADSINPDTSNPQAFNRYSYTFNNPMRYVDPSGHAPNKAGLVPPPHSLSVSEWPKWAVTATQVVAFILGSRTSLEGDALKIYQSTAMPGPAADVIIQGPLMEIAGDVTENVVRGACAGDCSDEVGEILYRGMKEAEDGLPMLRNSSSGLGVRPSDIAVDAGGFVAPSINNPQGMSVSPGSPGNLPPSMRPSEFGGMGRNPVWSIRTGNLGPDLTYIPDPANPNTHGFIAPAYRMLQEKYLNAIQGLRSLWEKVIP